jgi:hypothetical protein
MGVGGFTYSVHLFALSKILEGTRSESFSTQPEPSSTRQLHQNRKIQNIGIKLACQALGGY